MKFHTENEKNKSLRKETILIVQYLTVPTFKLSEIARKAVCGMCYVLKGSKESRVTCTRVTSSLGYCRLVE